ncbi:MAG: cytochrome P450 [Myxococcota bacterium]
MPIPPPVLPDVDFAIQDLPDLHEILAELRKQGPAVPVLFATRPLWMILGYDAVKRAMTDEEHLSTAEAYKRSLGRTMGPVMATMSGEAHRKNRGVVSAVFFPKAMRAQVEPVFRVEAEKLADELSGERQVDLVRGYTRRLTFNIITRLLGLPVTDVDRLMSWADRIMAQGWDFEAALRARDEMGAYLEPVVRERRESPGDDFLSLLVQAEIDGEGLEDEEVYAFCRNLFPAAIDTSTNSLGSLLHVVLHQPAIRTMSQEGEKQREAIVQELLRYEPPLALVPRRCMKDIEIGTQKLSAGESVMLSIASANNDPVEFPEPRRFDPSRGDRHLAFGHGEHFCIGSHMARRVLETGLEVLLRRFPELAPIPDKPARIVHGTLRGPRELWVDLGAARGLSEPGSVSARIPGAERARRSST